MDHPIDQNEIARLIDYEARLDQFREDHLALLATVGIFPNVEGTSFQVQPDWRDTMVRVGPTDEWDDEFGPRPTEQAV